MACEPPYILKLGEISWPTSQNGGEFMDFDLPFIVKLGQMSRHLNHHMP